MKKQLLLLAMIILPMVVSADPVDIDGIYYNLNPSNITAEVTSNPNKYTGNVVIPEKVTFENVEYSVTSIGNYAFSDCTGLTSVTIPNSVVSIGGAAFDNCSGLTSVTIPNSVVSIGVNAFVLCSSLTSITIPNSVTSIGGSAFFGCSGLTSISISDNLTSIEYGTFCNCSSLTSVIIPNGVTSIGENAFSSCSGLTSIVIPNTVTSIGKYAFRFTRVTSIVIPNSVTSIGSEAFFQCKDLTSVTIGNSVKSIGENAFKFCRLQNVVAKNSKTTINQNGSFDQSTLNHAILYIPVGQRWDYVYGGSWYKFLNMKEMAAETSEISERNAYLLMNAKSFKYMVYDEVNDEVRTINSFYDVDENVASNNWQFVNIDGQKCLYNIKAKKYASISQEGKIQLQASPIPLIMSNGSDGIIVDGNEEIQYNFVVNDKMAIDLNPTGIDMVRDSEFKGNTYYDLNGRKLSEKPSQKGIYINNGKKLVVK